MEERGGRKRMGGQDYTLRTASHALLLARLTTTLPSCVLDKAGGNAKVANVLAFASFG